MLHTCGTEVFASMCEVIPLSHITIQETTFHEIGNEEKISGN